MKKYRVYIAETVSTCIEVEADDEEAAGEAALERGAPQLMFLDHTFPDESDVWEIVEVEEVP